MKSINQAVILAGGLGTRLRPLTDSLPKPMIPINNKPFLGYLVDLLKENKINEIVMLLGYMPEKIQEHFKDGLKFGINIKYSVGDISFNTGTRIKHAENLLDDNFLMLYGDNYWPMNLEKMIKNYKKLEVPATVTIYNNKDGFGEYGFENNIHVSDEGIILDYDKTRKNPNANGVDMGFYILSKNILDLMPEHNFSFENEILPILIKHKQLGAYKTDHRYYYMTSLETLNHMKRFLEPKKVIFLDRDGVINEKAPEHDYVKKWEEFKFLPGAIKAIKILNKNNFEIYIVTNQRGIARNMMSENDLKTIHKNMGDELSKHGARINSIYYCPHEHDERCNCRKPKPGMFFQAANTNYIDLTKSVFIGDGETDLQAGEAANIKTYLVSPKKSLLNIVNSLFVKK